MEANPCLIPTNTWGGGLDIYSVIPSTVDYSIVWTTVITIMSHMWVQVKDRMNHCISQSNRALIRSITL